jgi:hypothetical protein
VEKLPIDKITNIAVDHLHEQFCVEMTRLFDRTKAKYDCKDSVLEII